MNYSLRIFCTTVLLQSILGLHFDLRMGKIKCFIEELYTKNMALIKYSISGLDGTDEENASYYNMISLRVTHIKDRNIMPIDGFLKTMNGKFTFVAQTEGQYKVCVFPFPSKYTPKSKVTMNLLILSDNMDEPMLLNAVKKEEVDRLHDKVESILKKGGHYTDHQNNLIRLEEQDYKSIVKVQKVFFYLTIAQIFVVVFLGIYQVLNFKSYLEKNVLDL